MDLKDKDRKFWIVLPRSWNKEPGSPWGEPPQWRPCGHTQKKFSSRATARLSSGYTGMQRQCVRAQRAVDSESGLRIVNCGLPAYDPDRRTGAVAVWVAGYPCAPLGFHIVRSNAAGGRECCYGSFHCLVCNRWFGGVPRDGQTSCSMLFAAHPSGSSSATEEDMAESALSAGVWQLPREHSVLSEGGSVPGDGYEADDEEGGQRNSGYQLLGSHPTGKTGSLCGAGGETPPRVFTPILDHPDNTQGLSSQATELSVDQGSLDMGPFGSWEILPEQGDLEAILLKNGEQMVRRDARRALCDLGRRRARPSQDVDVPSEDMV